MAVKAVQSSNTHYYISYDLSSDIFSNKKQTFFQRRAATDQKGICKALVFYFGPLEAEELYNKLTNPVSWPVVAF